MFTLTKEFRFEASHRLPHHDGKCARLHGHSWVGRIIVQGDTLIESGPKSGMLVDYSDIKAAVNHLIEEYLDHWHLNDSLGMESPTSERIAKWLFDQLKANSSIYAALLAVEIDETCTSSCRYECRQPERGSE